ncbi:MAG: hypothetical protein IKW87_10050 [Ruminococcus sp.]|nr:hypothetical protein [Ruminococcus sp.]
MPEYFSENDINNDIPDNGEQPQPTEQELKKLHRHEIKKLLMGNLMRREDGKAELRNELWVTPWGVGDGAVETLIFGVSQRRYVFDTSLRNKTQAVYQSEKTMRDIGNVLYMHSAPELRACYVRRFGFRPVILAFDIEEDELVLRAYSGRAPLTFLSIMHAVSLFEKALPSQIYRKGRKPAQGSNKKSKK